MKPLKIAVYSGEIPSTTFIERLIAGLASSTHHVYLFGVRRKPLRYPNRFVLKKGYRSNRFSKLFTLFTYGFLLFLFKNKDKRKLDAHIRNCTGRRISLSLKFYPVLWHRPDIFHLQWAKSTSDWIWVQEFGMKLVLSLRGAHINYSPITISGLAETYRKTFPRVDGFHAVSEAIAKEAQKYGADPQKIQVIYSGLTKREKFYKTSQNAEFTIVSVGRNHWKKGYDYALNALQLLQTKNIPFRYTVVGAANSEELLFLIHALNIQGEVTLTDSLPYEEAQSLIGSADVLLLPSIEEGIANVVLEAMQLGTLVLSSDCGGMREVITDGENGFLFAIRNKEELANKLEKIYRLPENYKKQITDKARQTIEKRHTAALMIQNMLLFYKKILQS